jgi:antitoxin HicB
LDNVKCCDLTPITLAWTQYARQFFKGVIKMKFMVILEPAEEGGFDVSVPALDGCFTQGKNEKESLKNVKEAIKCYLEGIQKVNEIKTKPGFIAKEVKVSL